MTSDGKAPRTLPIRSYSRPAWSPDGTRIAVDGAGIVIANADGSAATKIADGRAPAWSPEGDRLAFEKARTSECEPNRERIRIFSVATDGSNEIQLSGATRSPLICIADDAHPDWQPRCTRYGSGRPDRLTGTPAPDVICALGAKDSVHGEEGNDIVIGGDGDDTILGGSGTDWLFGSAGDDVINARDGEPDIVNGGPGRDRARVDAALDRILSVERLVE